MATKELNLIPHDGLKYLGQTVMLSGHSFFNCVFEGCTLLVTNVPFATKNVEFRQCNVRVEYDLLWGAPETVTALRKTLDLFSGKTSVISQPPAPAVS
jgi:hypothetical protein